MTDPHPDDETPLDRLTAAVQAFVNEVDHDAPVLLDSAVVVFERVRLDEDGEAARRVEYALAGRSSLAVSVGLAEVGRQQMLADIVGHGRTAED